MTTQKKSQSEVIGPNTPVAVLMTRTVARIAGEARLQELARKLAAVEAGAMVVGTASDLVGIVSERDLTRAYGRSDSPDALQVSDICSSEIIWCEPDTSAARAARLMVQRGVRHLVVGHSDESEVEGIVSARDLMDALVER